MNYFSKYVKKFQNGGSIDEEVLDLFVENINECIALMGDNEEAAKQLQNIAVAADDPTQRAQILENTELMDQLKQLVVQVTQDTAAPESSPASFKTGGKVEYLSYLKCGGVPDCGCGKKLRKKPVKAEDGTALPEKTGFFSKIIKKFTGAKNSNETPQTTEKIIYINENGVPFENQSAAPGLQYTKPYGEVREDGYTSWRQNDFEAGPIPLLKRPAEYRILRNGVYVLSNE